MMEDFYIKTCDNFFPAFVRRQIIANYLNYGSNFTYIPDITYTDLNIRKNWEKYNNNITGVEAFNYRLEKKDEHYEYLEKNIKAFIESKFGIKVKQILRIMLVYIPPTPNFKENSILGPHVDMFSIKHMNLLYYIYDNDADTLFFDKIHDHKSDEQEYHKVNVYKQVEVKENRAVLFNGLIYHAANASRYTKRITLNCNFIPEFTQNS